MCYLAVQRDRVVTVTAYSRRIFLRSRSSSSFLIFEIYQTMKNFSLMVGIVLLALACSSPDDSIVSIGDAPPINHAAGRPTSKGSPRARFSPDCANQWCAFFEPNALTTLYGGYDNFAKGSNPTVWWRISPSGNYGYFPVDVYQTLTLSLRGPAPGYPLVWSRDVPNTPNEYGPEGILGSASVSIPLTVPVGWYYYELEYVSPNGACTYSAVDFRVSNHGSIGPNNGGGPH
jgi:hypothetical protein